jgi:phosphate transport system protein
VNDKHLSTQFDAELTAISTRVLEMGGLAESQVKDPRTISACIDLVFVAKAIERVGDHAKNLAEQIIYIVKGADVRHTPMEGLESALG